MRESRLINECTRGNLYGWLKNDFFSNRFLSIRFHFPAANLCEPHSTGTNNDKAPSHWPLRGPPWPSCASHTVFSFSYKSTVVVKKYILVINIQENHPLIPAQWSTRGFVGRNFDHDVTNFAPHQASKLITKGKLRLIKGSYSTAWKYILGMKEARGTKGLLFGRMNAHLGHLMLLPPSSNSRILVQLL